MHSHRVGGNDEKRFNGNYKVHRAMLIKASEFFTLSTVYSPVENFA